MSTFLSIEEARSLYQTDDSAHDFDHVLRVARMAEIIARAEGANVETVHLAALLHDVPVSHTTDIDARLLHHVVAALFARTFLTDRGMDAAAADQVSAAIESHRFRDQTRPPQTLEARCLYDADKLDSMGAIGVARAFAYAGLNSNRLYVDSSGSIEQAALAGAHQPHGPHYTPVHEFVYKLRRLLDSLHTPTARSLGMERHAFMLSFFSQIDAEMTGER